MVKLDTSRDYYGDLDLPDTCTTEDVKRQFRKLALKYHPDRNPGKEIEYNPKFQAISAAHEILADDEQRSKYDSVRRNASTTAVPRFSRAPPTRGSPYEARSAYPPPPRRAASSTPQKPQPGPGANSTGGADRYNGNNFPQPPPRSAPTAKKNASDRANMFSAWQNMNHTQASAPKMAPRPDRRPSDGSNMTGSTDGSWTASGTSGTSKNSPYAQAQQNRANPQHNDAFGRRQKHQVSPAFDPSGSGQSSGTPSQSQGASYQAHPGPPPPPRPQPQAGTTRRSDPMRDFRQRSGDEVPFAEGSPRTSSPYASNAGERTYFVSEQLRRSESTRDHTKTYHAQADDPRTGTTGPRRRSDSVQMESTANEVGAGSNRKTTAFTVGSSDEESATSSARPVGDATQQPPGVPTRPLKKPSRTWSRRSETASKGSESRTDNSTASGARRVHHDTDEASIFHIPVDADTFKPTGMKFPDPAIVPNIQFTSASESPSFQFGSPTPDVSVQRADGPSQTMPVGGRPADRSVYPAGRASGVPYQNDNGKSSQNLPSSTGFSVHEWSQHLQDGNWASGFGSPLPPTSLPTRPVLNPRRKTATLGAKSDKIYSVPPPFVAGEEAIVDSGASHPPHGRRDSDAMDIDSSSPVTQPSAVFPAAPGAARQGYGNTIRPDWREREADRFAPPHSVPLNQGRRPSQSVDIDSLRSVPPISVGIPDAFQNMNADLASNLPPPPPPPLPPPPRIDLTLSSAPAAPLAPLGNALTSATWNTHVIHMAAYLRQYYAWLVELTRRLADTTPKLLRLSGGATAFLGGGLLAQSGWEEYVEALKAHDALRSEIGQEGQAHLAAVHRHIAAKHEAERKGL